MAVQPLQPAGGESISSAIGIGIPVGDFMMWHTSEMASGPRTQVQ